MPNNLHIARLFNIPGDVFTHHLTPYLTPFEILNFLSACPSPSYSNIQYVLSQDKFWAFYFQRYLPFIKISVENNGNLFFKEEGRYHLSVLEGEDEVYLKKGNELYIQKGNGERLLYDYKTAFRFEIHHFLNNLKKNEGNWQDDILQSKLLRSDKPFMLEAISRNPRAYQFVSRSLKADREIVCTAMKSTRKKEWGRILNHASPSRKNEVKGYLRDYNTMIFGLFLLACFFSIEDDKRTCDTCKYFPVFTFAFFWLLKSLAEDQVLNVYGLFAKKYPGNHIDSYEGAHEEHKTPDESDQSSDDENERLELNY